jgi:hypothetical protein
MLQHFVHAFLFQRIAANNAIFRVVTNANCPKTNLNVYISNDLTQAGAQEPTFIRKGAAISNPNKLSIEQIAPLTNACRKIYGDANA